MVQSTLRPAIPGFRQVLPSLAGIKGVVSRVGVGVLGALEKRDLAEILVVHEVAIQPFEVEQMLDRLAEVLVLEDWRLQIHMQAVDT